MNFCECGCGTQIFGLTTKGTLKRFVLGHNWKNKKRSKESVSKSVESRKGFRHSEETKQIIKEKRALQVFTEESKIKMSQSAKGKKKSKEHCKNISKSKKGKPSKRKGKTLEEIYGSKKAKKIKRKTSVKMKAVTKKWKGVALEKRIGKKKAVNIKKKQRIARIKQIEQNCGQCWPNYNKEACEFFKSFDEINNTKGCYAIYGGGEFYISELGYWPDYINFDLKLIMEWDEFYHYDKDGSLRQRDIQRQKEIQELYPDFIFKRIKSEVEVSTKMLKLRINL